jgi:D-alanyl-D-alanine carboxypeptidase/D-alanyl-D-alanine-endopeptidase (penicillin-binding protein 4)
VAANALRYYALCHEQENIAVYLLARKQRVLGPIGVLLGALAALGTTSAAELPPLVLAARQLVGADQGVYVEAVDGSVLVAQAAATPVHPASVSKVPTTLALLHKFGCDYRFTTTFAANGPTVNGTLKGDLIVDSEGDPFFVDENALLVAERLREMGIVRVAGTVRAHDLIFDWDHDDGARLRQTLEGIAPAAAWEAVRTLEVRQPVGAELPMPVLRFGGAATAAAVNGALPNRVLLRHRSQPLLSMAKALNDYSNNIFKPFADAAGGAASVQSLAQTLLPAEMRTEITLGDGAGTDPSNRLSPRAAVKLLRALEAELASAGHSLVDVLPVAGVDAGTLQKRIDGAGEVGHVVGKTGTFGDYGASALVGALSTTDYGTVYFAILNHGVPVSEARRRQDSFVRVLLATLTTQPWIYAPDPRPAVARATVEVVSDPESGRTE